MNSATRLINKIIPWIVIVCVIIAYRAILPPGAFLPHFPFSNYYSRLTETLLAGHLDLGSPPDGLLELENPYDPNQANRYTNDRSLKIWDLSLYREKLYIYFGLAPVLTFFMPLKLLGLGALATDPNAVWVASVAIVFISLSLFVALLRGGAFRLSRISLALLLVTLLSANWVPILLARCRTYDVASAFGLLFSLLTTRLLIAIVSAMDGKATRAKIWLIVGAGVSAGMTVAARPHFGAAMVISALCVSFLIRKKQQWLFHLILLWAPFLTILSGLALYNYLRFENPLEFGFHWQLGLFDARHVQSFALDRAPANIYLLLFHPFQFSQQFPWIESSVALPSWLNFSKLYYIERPVGVLLALPVLWCGVAALLRFIWQYARRLKPTVRPETWLLLIPLCANFSLLALWVASIDRYSADFLTYAVLLSLCAGVQLVEKLATRGAVARWIAEALVLLLTIPSIYVGWALAINDLQQQA